jgi:hypothetical protein
MTALEVITETQAPVAIRRLCIEPRAAALTIAGDASLDDAYRVCWEGAAPRVREHDEVTEIDYTLPKRLRAASPRGGSLALALSPAVAWAIELRGGVSGLRADLRGLWVAAITITGGASDLVIDLPTPTGELPLRVEGGVSRATVRRPKTAAVSLHVEGGASELRLDAHRFGSIGGTVRQRTATEATGSEVAIRVLGGASRLTIERIGH